MEKIKFPQGKSVNMSYDKEADVLYVSFGEPRVSETLDSGEDLLIRFEPETCEITGFTILNFSEVNTVFKSLSRPQQPISASANLILPSS